MKNYFRVSKITALILACCICFCACSDRKGETTDFINPSSAASDMKERPNSDFKKAPANSKEDIKPSPDNKIHPPKKDAVLPSATKNEEPSTYEKCITDNFASFPGTYSYAFHIYGTDHSKTANNSQQKSASIIKLFIMEYAYSQMEKGELKADSTIGGKKLSSLIEAMITYSDNDATNTLINHFTMKKINAFISSCGYSDTVLGRKMLDTAAAARGEENYTSVGDVMKFLDKLYANRETYPYNEMLSVMKRQQIATKIRRDIPSGVEIASKTGELSDTDNDAGIIFTSNGDFAFVCFTQNASPEPARDCIAKSARAMYDLIMKKE
ncbi:MAG: serine hydrolase [Clostridia bacterium]|nr:serine hydrolase [Clostridia bacterium]